MFKKIGLGLMVVLGGLCAFAAMQPSHYEVAREIAIQAPAEKIFPYLNNMRLAEQWGPWKEVDPQATMEYSGPEEGVGAKSSWHAGKELGTGSATIVESLPNQRVSIKLEYQEPMVMTQSADYLISVNGDQSLVSWKVQGENSFIGRLMCAFVDMDSMVGGMFEKGLLNLKQLVEAAP